MKNNDILRRLRYTFDLSDSKMMELFKLGGYPATRAEISDWLKKEEDPDHKALYDKMLATVLNGMIIHERGKKEGEELKAEKSLNNNIIFRKIKIALTLTSDEIVEIFDLVDVRISKHEVTSFFRKPGSRQYRICHDQYLRNFIYGLQVAYKEDED